MTRSRLAPIRSIMFAARACVCMPIIAPLHAGAQDPVGDWIGVPNVGPRSLKKTIADWLDEQTGG